MLFGFSFSNCKSRIKQQNDDVYSRHLQRHVKLTIINTPIPEDKSKLNLLILNDGQDIEKFRVKEIVDSLWKKNAIQPLLIVAVHAGDRMQEYGVADQADYMQRGSKAGYYDAFLNGELYPFVKKKAGVRKFKSVAIAGCSLGGLSAFDFAWNHTDKIDKVGVFSGSFWWRNKDAAAPDYSDDRNRIMYAKLMASRKALIPACWFYAGGKEENSDRDKDGIIDAVDDTKDIVNLLEMKFKPKPMTVSYTEDPQGQHDWPYWSKQLPAFLVWAFPK